ncbi:hypothetical protein HZC07_01970 [Candidatus Micrarchaeota archaeon]|nr:hypothetical protein [Candidatus Micrarchaeota archaeon]
MTEKLPLWDELSDAECKIRNMHFRYPHLRVVDALKLLVIYRKLNNDRISKSFEKLREDYEKNKVNEKTRTLERRHSISADTFYYGSLEKKGVIRNIGSEKKYHREYVWIETDCINSFLPWYEAQNGFPLPDELGKTLRSYLKIRYDRINLTEPLEHQIDHMIKEGIIAAFGLRIRVHKIDALLAEMTTGETDTSEIPDQEDMNFKDAFEM